GTSATLRGVSKITICLRFLGQLNPDLRKLTPLIAKCTSQYRNYSAAKLTSQMFAHRNILAASDPKNGRYLYFHRNMEDVDEQMFSVHAINDKNFVEWIPNNDKAAVYDIPECYLNRKNCNIYSRGSTNSTIVLDSHYD
uniref:Tubulin/FtsZ 2-layer sandwich domain-containing protein n=1 Tax=Glossina palpalis gambiensis TaxID=67801 RepID=A0A1B0BDV2_9MUSC